MLLRVLVAFANAFVCIYAIDAVFSLIEEGLRSATGSQHLLGTRNVIALTVVAAAPFALIAATLSRRLPPLVLAALAGVPSGSPTGRRPSRSSAAMQRRRCWC